MSGTINTLRIISMRRPDCGLIENVCGMAETFESDTLSGLEFVKQELADQGYVTGHVCTDLASFHECVRKRIADAALPLCVQTDFCARLLLRSKHRAYPRTVVGSISQREMPHVVTCTCVSAVTPPLCKISVRASASTYQSHTNLRD